MVFPDHGVKAEMGALTAEELLNQPHIVLGAGNTDPETVRQGTVGSQTLHKIRLPEDIPGVLQKDRSLFRRTDALAGPLKDPAVFGGNDPLGRAAEDPDAGGVLQLLDDPAQIGLAHIEIRSGLGDGTGSFDLNQVLKLLCIQIHGA